MAKYRVKHTNIMHNQDLYKEGDIIELKEEEAARLSDFVDKIAETSSVSNSTKSNSKTTKTSTKTSTKTKTETKNETQKTEGVTPDGGADNGK